MIDSKLFNASRIRSRRLRAIYRGLAATASPAGKSRPWAAFWKAGLAAGVVGLLVAAAWLVYALGGVDSGASYLMLLPVLAAVGMFGLGGGIGASLIGALLLGPYMPKEMAPRLEQPPEEWLTRLAVFLLVGIVTGVWRDRLRSETRAQLQAARVDPTSGLPNAVAFREDLQERLAAQPAERQALAAVLLRATDLDDIVDVTGVDGADHVLRMLAEHLRRSCPEVTGVYRFSGSELALILETYDCLAMKRIVRGLHDAASASVEVDGAPVRIEPAIGMGHPGSEDSPAHELIRRARIALRRAMSLERDWVSYEPAIDTDTRTAIELVARAEKALQAGEFELHYQPKMRLHDQRVVGAEALVRWRRPGEGVVPPGSFMPKLEQTSLIDAFSRFVIREGTDFARQGVVTPISINLAPRNLADERLIDDLLEGLRQTNTPPEAFEVEITESALMREPEEAITLLHRLRDAGIGVSIDDFGTGYSSFAYLRRMPATDLKIDRAFVRPLEGDARTRSLVLAMVESGHALAMTVTAEGIETEAQARILADLGCDMGQGFLWSRPVPDSELIDWLDRRPELQPST